MNKELPIGVFDSGVGGLTVVKELIRQLPGEDIVYLGDTARVPYGIRSEETVRRYALENAEFLMSIGVKLIVVACNTVSAVALDRLKERVSIPVIGVLKPGAEAAVRATEKGLIGVIGTETTIKSSSYEKEIKRLSSDVKVIGKACPLFVPLVEEGIIDGEIARLVAKRYLDDLKTSGIDTLVLGCTHYPLLKKTIGELLEGVVLIDSAEETAIQTKRLLKEKGLMKNRSNSSRMSFYVTDSPERFKEIGRRFLNDLIVVRKVQF